MISASQKLSDEWQKYFDDYSLPTEINENEVTAETYAKNMGIHPNTARTHLKRMVVNGDATCRKIKIGGKILMVFILLKK